MTLYNILQNVNLAHVVTTDVTSGQNWGIRFKPNVDGWVRKLRWYSQGSSNRRPDTLILYDDANRGAITSAIPPTDNTGSGWTDYTLASPLFVEANKPLAIVGHYPGTAGTAWRIAYIASANIPTIPTVFTLQVNHQATLSGGTAYPTGHIAGNMVLVDIEFDTDFVPDNDQPPTVGSITAELAEWLDTEAQTHQLTGLPWLTWDLLTDPSAGLAAMKAITDDLLASLDAAMGPGGDLVTGTLRPILDAVVTTLQASLDTTETTVMGPGNPTIADVMNAIDAIPTTPPPGFPLTVGDLDWTQTAQTVGSGGYAWAQPADAYKITVEEVGDEVRSARQIGTETIYWLRSWARPWDGVSVYTPNHEIVGLSSIVMTDQRWPGIMFYFPPGVEWTVTAYDYTP